MGAAGHSLPETREAGDSEEGCFMSERDVRGWGAFGLKHHHDESPSRSTVNVLPAVRLVDRAVSSRTVRTFRKDALLSVTPFRSLGVTGPGTPTRGISAFVWFGGGDGSGVVNGDKGSTADRMIGDAVTVRDVFEQTPTMLVALEGPEHRLVAANAVYRAAVGRPEPIGMTALELWPETVTQGVHVMLDRAFSTGEVQKFDAWRTELELPQGRREFFFDLLVVPRKNADGTQVGLIIQLGDATERVMEQRAVQERADESQRRYEQALDMVATLQKALLPTSAPLLPRLRIAARYLLALEDTAAGGDWFDALALPDGRVGLVVGDVVGHGVQASAVMGQLRTVVLERLHAGEDPADVLASADRFAALVPGAHAATCAIAVLGPADGRLLYASAGHPPPLLISADGSTRYLTTTAGPLGTGARYSTMEDHVPDEALLLLYTDGIIERPTSTPEQGKTVLAETAANAVMQRAFQQNTPQDVVERTVDQTLELLLRDGGHTDDVTLLAVQRAFPPSDFGVVLPAVVDSVRDIQYELGRWLLQLGCTDEDESALQHAVVELVTNVVDHAYQDIDSGDPDVDRSIWVQGRLDDDGTVCVEVADRGRWPEAPHPDPFRGRGLAMVELFTDSLHIDRGALPAGSGTTARIGRRLSRPVAISPGMPALRPRTLELTIEEDLDTIGLLRLHGAVDSTTVTQLKARLLSGSRAGTTTLTLDLTGLTHLASAGVQLLHRVKALFEDQQQTFTLLARHGCVAASVLELADLPYADPGSGSCA
ncbi:SpoIIE family protein phosphatase [Streptomyces sp. NPDC060085]|uniref:ATP-binding SpoIIE family protein phosphatase n=1 Tax=Streptomyces sp. NPDC060085 TaxID=3347054 RepID=UPI003663060E